jgi:tetratricopeptide (TPR) repeat protein
VGVRSLDSTEAPFTAVLTIYPGEVIDGSPAHGFAESSVILGSANRASDCGLVDLRWGADRLATGITTAQFLAEFWAGAGPAHCDALELGRGLLRRVLGHPRLRERWAKIEAWRGARPLRLELILPAAASSLINAIPFELFAEHTFLFYAGGATLVRCVRDLEPRRAEIRRGDRLVVAWANPTNLAGRFDDAVFERHQAELTAAGGTAQLDVQPPVARAGLAQLQDALADHGPIAVLSLVAHGYPTGGQLALEHPDRSSQPVAASDIAAAARGAKTQVALLWSCHAARHHADLGSLAERLLDPAGGDLAAVVAAHGALQADWTARAARRLLRALTAADGNDLEHAVAVARQTLGEQSPHWAALAYYARPADGRSVSYADASTAAIAALAPAAVARAPVTRSGFDPVDPIRSPDGGILISRSADVDVPPGSPPPDLGPPVSRSGRVTGAAVTVTGLPAEPFYWVDRPAEVRAVGALVAAHRVVSVGGMPGIGKTEVARAAARRVIDTAAIDAALWIPLDELGSIDDLRARIAAWAGVADPDAPDARLARAIGARRALWILDNAEDLVRDHGPALRRLLTAVIEPCPGLRLLVTSQRPLGDLHGEREHRHVVRRIEDAAACRALFAAAAGSPLDARAPAADLAAILDLLDGHPRSLVLVASQIRDGGANLPQLRARLVERTDEAVLAVDLLASGVDWDAHDRLRAERLVSSLHLAYRPLRDHAPRATELFCWLGTLPAGLPVALAPAIFGPDVLDHVATLLRVSLVELRGDDERLELPAPIRWYAARRLAQDVAPARQAELVARSFDAIASLMEAAYPRLGKPGAGAVLDASRREAQNLEALHDRVESAGPVTPELATLVARAFWRWSAVRTMAGSHAPQLVLVERARRMIGAAASGSVAGHLELQLGELYMRTDRLADAEAAYDRALAAFAAIADRFGKAETKRALGYVYYRTARLAGAEAAYQQALAGFATLDDRHGEANTRLALGDLYLHTDRLADAETAYHQALAASTASDNHLGEANARLALGHIYLRTNRLDDADAAYQRAFAGFVTIDDRRGEAATVSALGRLAAMRGQLADGFRQLLAARKQLQSIGDRVGAAGQLGWMARAAHAARRFGRAIVLGGSARRELQTIDDRFGAMLAVHDLLEAARAAELPQLAGPALLLAWHEARAIEDKVEAQLAPLVGELLTPEAFDAGLSPVQVAVLERQLAAAVAEVAARLAAAGEDPFGPLPATPEPA